MSDYKFTDRITRSFRTRFLSPADEMDVNLLPFTTEHQKRYRVFEERWKYYRSRHRAPLRTRKGQKDTNIAENFTRQIVNDSVYFLFGDGKLSFEIGDVEPGDDPPEEKLLREFWKPRSTWNPAAFLEKIGQAGAITGQPFIRLHTNPETDEIRLSEIDGSMVNVLTSDSDIEDVHEYQHFWQSTDDSYWRRQRIIKSDNGESWDIVQERYEGAEWRSDGEEPVDWPYDFPPIFTCQNLPLAHSFWGMSDIEEAALNDSINEIMTDMRKTIHYYASPTTIAKGLTRSQIKRDMLRTETGNILPIPLEADLYNLEMMGDLKASQDVRRTLVDTYMSTTDSVRLDPHFTSFGQLSGFAIQLLYMPLLAKTARKRNTYGAMLSQVNSAVLQLRGVREPMDVTTLWPSALPTNRLEMAQIASMVASFGNVRGALEFAKFSPEEIEAILAEVERLEMTTPYEELPEDIEDEEPKPIDADQG